MSSIIYYFASVENTWYTCIRSFRSLAADAQLNGVGIVKSRLIKKIESHESMLKKIKDGINGEPHNILPGTQSKLFYKTLDYLDIEIMSVLSRASEL